MNRRRPPPPLPPSLPRRSGRARRPSVRPGGDRATFAGHDRAGLADWLAGALELTDRLAGQGVSGIVEAALRILTLACPLTASAPDVEVEIEWQERCVYVRMVPAGTAVGHRSSVVLVHALEPQEG